MTTAVEINSLLIQAQARAEIRIETMAALSQYERDCLQIAASGLGEANCVSLCEGARDTLADALRGLLTRADPKTLPAVWRGEGHARLTPDGEVGPSLVSPWSLGDIVRTFGRSTTLHCVTTEESAGGCGVYVLAGDGCTSEERANVCLTLAAPVLLDAARRARAVLLHCEASPEGSRAENVTAAADVILDMLDTAIDAAVATLAPRAEPTGGEG